ncbi:MAG: hypothetical protein B7X95_00080 [Methylophilaceae bacterium 17-44-8]|jgi:hypothetical protein|nr:MAG: hypothetical protein B7Y48_04535 [Methylophilales bacterium 28-44-11]OYZ08231.1 MAG: hypothetical protein B7Y32_02180 [Methylophilales bacterium 16-45-7]OZA07090.1 MAG: hypothetical protein B7X95_00080 [Methylophilaceae bacterium 17-44-8]
MSQIQDNTAQLQSELEQGKALASLLDSHAQQLSMQTLTRLEEGRVLAVQRHVSKTSGHQVNQNGTLSSWFSWEQHPRMLGAGMLSLALIVGLTLTLQLSQQNENSDAFLLGSELPPEAFVDRGFEPWLNAKVEL